MTDTNTDAETTDEQHATDGGEADPTATVTPYAVEGAVDYDRLVERFGADRLDAETRARFPGDHPMLRRGTYFAGRDVEPFLDAVERGDRVSVVTGVGPSGPLHLGHALTFHVARHLQREAGAFVVIPVSDDEKRYAKGLTLDETGAYARENLRDVLAFGFDPERTRVVVDTADADALYPTAARVAGDLTTATVEAAYGEPPNVGLGFYPAMQATHLLLPQLLHGPHPTLVPVGVDQDPHVRVCRDVAGKERYDVRKPGDLLARFVPALDGEGKLSSSAAGGISLADDPEEVRERVMDAYSGGRATVADHRDRGGDPEVDVAFRLLRYFFEPDDAALARLERAYRDGDVLAGDLKERAADRIAAFVRDHRERRPTAPFEEVVAPYRLRDDERERLGRRAGESTTKEP